MERLRGMDAVSAVVVEEIMQAAQSTFISSTFWTERIGSVAALKTLEVMERELGHASMLVIVLAK